MSKLNKIKKWLWLPVFFIVSNIYANNIRISNVQRLDAAGAKNEISFDLSWDNSWRVSGTPGNNDAAWVFVKFRECGVGGTWQHGLLDLSMINHTFASTVTYADTLSLNDRLGNLPGGATASNGLGNNTGIMIQRSSIGVGNITNATVVLKLVNPTSVLDPSVTYDIRVFGIEMVKVMEDNFSIGDGGSSNSFTNTIVSTQGAIAAGFLYSGSPVLPADYPKGFTQFYCMKYEISQSQFANFMNHSNLTGGSPITYSGINRNNLKVGSAGVETSTPCNAQNYMAWDDLLGYLDWAALRPMTELEYEKACLGPLSAPSVGTYAWGNNTLIKAWVISKSTEDGTEIVVTDRANAHCYHIFRYGLYNTAGSAKYGSVDLGYSGSGSRWIQSFNTSTYSFYYGEQYLFNSTTTGNRSNFAYPVLALNDPTSPTDYIGQGFGPIGVGIFARDSTLARVTTGGSYYGIMEMSGNVYEQCINVTTTAYKGSWGNGYLPLGKADVADWPGGVNTLTNRALRGGSYATAANRLAVADRFYRSTATQTNRTGTSGTSYLKGDLGGRGVR